jgi:hypothetical protein
VRNRTKRTTSNFSPSSADFGTFQAYVCLIFTFATMTDDRVTFQWPERNRSSIMNALKSLPYRVITVPLLLVTVLRGAACGGSDGGSNKKGIASFDIADAPVDDVTQVQLTINRFALKRANGSVIEITPEEPIVISNLLDLQGGNAAPLIPDTEFPAGRYNWIRLYISGGFPDSYVVTDEGGSVDLFIPGQQANTPADNRFLQLVSGFVIPAGGNVDFTIDVDLRRALTKPANSDHYLLRPALRITDNSETGSLSGTVDAALLNDESCTNDLASDTGNAVYLFNGNDAVTGDVHVDDNGEPVGDNNPLITGNVTLDTESGLYTYSIGFVPAGDYSVALTCQALDDAPDQDDVISFLQTQNASVIAEQNTEVNFSQ